MIHFFGKKSSRPIDERSNDICVNVDEFVVEWSSFLEQELMWPIYRIQTQENANAERKNNSSERNRSKVVRDESIEVEVTPGRTMTVMEVRTVQSLRLQPNLEKINRGYAFG